MAIVYRCDRCKQIGDEQSFLTDIVIPGSPALGDDKKTGLAADERRAGICQQCLATLRLWMESAA